MKKLTRHFNRCRDSAISAATYKKYMATNTATPTTETSYATGLAQWLDENGFTRHQLAIELMVSPHAIDNLVTGAAASVKKDILRAVAERTQLTYEQILNPVQNYVSPIATGDSRIDKCLAKLVQFMHTDAMYEECRLYVSPQFQCSGSLYEKLDIESVDFETMCKLNVNEDLYSFIMDSLPVRNKEQGESDVHILDTILSVTWYTPGGIDCHESRILHTYWRSLAIVKGLRATYNDTFVVLEFEKSINEMTPLEQPQIINWWWDQSSQYNRAPMESYPSDVNAAVQGASAKEQQLSDVTKKMVNATTESSDVTTAAPNANKEESAWVNWRRRWEKLYPSNP